MVTGIAIATFAISVCEFYTRVREGFPIRPANGVSVTFTLKAVGQDRFEDVIVPDAPQEPLETPKVQTNGAR